MDLSALNLDQHTIFSSMGESGIVLQKVIAAIAILAVTYVVAKIVKWAFARLINRIPILQRATAGEGTIGESLGKIAALFIWLFGLLGVLQVLGLNAVASPIDELLRSVMGSIPSLINAGIIMFVGMIIAGIVRDMLVTVLQTVGLDNLASKGGVENVTGNTAITKTIGNVVYAVIAISVGIAALEKLKIEAIATPATQMLNIILTSIPNIIVAALLLGLGYFISKFVVGLLGDLLGGLGVDRALGETGLFPDGVTASLVIARIAQVAIILFFAVAATERLGFPQITDILNEVLRLGGRVAFGAVIIGAGFLIANLLSKLVGTASEGSSAAKLVKIVTIVLFTVMGLDYTQLGGMLPSNALMALIIGASVAGALAFGLGGRDWAAKKLKEWDK